MPLLGARGNLIRFLAAPVTPMLELRARYGDVVPLTRDDPGWVLAFGSAYNRQILANTDSFHNFADHPVKLPPGSAASKFGLNLVNQNGAAHQRGRRLMTPAFSKSRLEVYAAMTADTSTRVLAHRGVGERVDAHELAIELSLSVALRCLFDVELGEGADELGGLVLDYLTRTFSPATALLPFDLPGTPYRRFLSTTERLGARVEQLIAERRHRSAGDDILSALIDAYAPDGEQAAVSDDELLGQVALLLIAGHDTIAHTLAWTLFLLSQHPAIQAALLHEIDAAALGEQPSLAGVMGLPLLDRVIKESMRLLPAVPLLFFRRSTQGFALGPHELPAGATIVISPLATHHCSSLYPNPRRFDPDRWLNTTPGPYEYLPYGAGPRLCVGMALGVQVLRTVLALLLQRFGVGLAEGAQVSYKTRGVLMGPKPGLTLRLLARDQVAGVGAGTRASVAGTRVRGNIHELVALER